MSALTDPSRVANSSVLRGTILSGMTISTRLPTILSRAGLVLAATGVLVFVPACVDSSPSDGDQQQEQQDDNGGNRQGDQDGNQEDD
jgi:hypothetical protein